MRTTVGTFAVGVSGDLDHPLVTVTGELDVATGPRLRDCLLGLPPDTREVQVDLTGVGFIDSTGLAVLLVAFKHYRTMGVPLRVSAASPVVARVLEITGLRPLLGTGVVQRA